MQTFDLPTLWQVQAVSNFEEVPPEIGNRALPAQVPGGIHLDLLRENLIPDPYLDQNEFLVQWIGRTDWEFSTTFSVSAEAMREERVDLVCEGLDTIATVWINGAEVGRSENMHVESRFRAKDVLKAGENEIRVRFASAVHYAREMRDRLGDLPHANSYRDADGKCEPFHFIRKNACNFGWDWGPALVTAGIWKAIRLEAWSVARIQSMRPLVRVANEKVAVVDFEVDVEFAEAANGKKFKAEVTLWEDESDEEAIQANELSISSGTASISLFKKNPKLWWPRGYGEQSLYKVWVVIWETAKDADRQLDFSQFQIGLREVELDTSPDDYGAVWTLKVNGCEIWCKGANWIPDDVFLPRANEPQRLQTRLQQAADAGMNTLRVWGGGIYETDAFYSLCDQMGLLVWQDFPFACAAYAEESPLKELVEAEARFNVARLSKHPSLVLWNGCNENIWGYFDWGWQQKVEGRTWGAGYYFDLLPSIVKELAPTTPYWPGSPFSGSMDIHPNADQWGNKHMWDTWNDVNHTHFRKYAPRFASEFGHQAPPTWATLKRAIPADQLDPFSPAMLHHQKAIGGNDKLHNRLKEHFEMPSDFDDWLFLTQLMQARAMTTAVEWFRTRSVCRGALFWQLNDCWPVTSWAAIDGDGRPKPLYFAAKQFFRDRLLTIQPDGQHLALWAHNDCDESWFGQGTMRLLTMEGEEKKSDTFRFFLGDRDLVKIGDLEGFEPANKQNEFLAVLIEGAVQNDECFWFFDIDKHLNYPEPKFEAKWNGNELELTAQTLIRDLYLNADRVGGEAEYGLVTLLPGETIGWEIKGVTAADLNLETLTSRPVLNCANFYGAKR